MTEVYDHDSHLDYQPDPFETIIRWICQVFLVGNCNLQIRRDYLQNFERITRN